MLSCSPFNYLKKTTDFDLSSQSLQMHHIEPEPWLWGISLLYESSKCYICSPTIICIIQRCHSLPPSKTCQLKQTTTTTLSSSVCLSLCLSVCLWLFVCLSASGCVCLAFCHRIRETCLFADATSNQVGERQAVGRSRLRGSALGERIRDQIGQEGEIVEGIESDWARFCFAAVAINQNQRRRGILTKKESSGREREPRKRSCPTYVWSQ